MATAMGNNNSNNSNDNGSSHNAIADNIVFAAKDQGAKQFQEDSTYIFHSNDWSVIVACVFDGHGGYNGREASRTCTEHSDKWFKQHWETFGSWSQQKWTSELIKLFDHLHVTIRERFIKLERERRQSNRTSLNNISDDKGVVRKNTKFPVHGGTTASVVIVLRQPKKNKWQIICANCGDSDCLLLARKPPKLKPDNDKCKHLSVDHSPDNASEYLRIKDLPTDKYPTKLLFVYDKANQCRKYECPLVFLDDGTKDPKFVKNPWGNNLRPTNVRYDPAVYAVSPYGVQHDITCIAMTRSLGDFYAHQFGLSFRPDVTFNELDMDKQEYIVTVGSDGIWDCWKWDDFTDYVNGIFTKHDSRLDATVKTVLKHTIQRAKACFGEGAYDDASLVLIALMPDRFPNNMNNNDNKNINDTNNNNNSHSFNSPDNDSKQNDSFYNNNNNNNSNNTDSNGNGNQSLPNGNSHNNNNDNNNNTYQNNNENVKGLDDEENDLDMGQS